MENFKLISEHYSPNSSTFVMLGNNNGRYEVRLADDEPFMLLNSFDNYHEAYAFAEKEAQN